jgi:alpha-tubulin suppressor-like RCC1 family protein
MKVMWRSRWLTRLAGGTGLALGLAGLVVASASTPAQARAGAVLIQSHVAASWGDNAAGELGDGLTTGSSRSLYADIGAGKDVVQVAGGRDHALAVRSDGTVWAWGNNQYGQLGDGNTAIHVTPTQVTGLTGITQVAAGVEFSLALRSDGTMWAWGANGVGQLGRGTITDHEVTPARVLVLNHVTKISAGRGFALALRSDGIVFAWGLNGSGELGNGTTTLSSRPVKIAGLSQVTGIAAGWDSAAAIEASSTSALTSVWTWGANDQGQLGDGTLAGHATPERVTGVPASVKGVSVGVRYAVVLGADGSVWGWGENIVGELAVAHEGDAVTRPVNAIAGGSGIIQLSAGGGHVLALRSDGTVLAWGDNQFGQLGNGTTAEVGGPGPVTGLTGATYVAGSFISSFAVHTVLGYKPSTAANRSLTMAAVWSAGESQTSALKISTSTSPE